MRRAVARSSIGLQLVGKSASELTFRPGAESLRGFRSFQSPLLLSGRTSTPTSDRAPRWLAQDTLSHVGQTICEISARHCSLCQEDRDYVEAITVAEGPEHLMSRDRLSIQPLAEVRGWSASPSTMRASASDPERGGWSLLDEGALPVEDHAKLAAREGKRQRPVYGAHKWFARRAGSAFRALRHPSSWQRAERSPRGPSTAGRCRCSPVEARAGRPSRSMTCPRRLPEPPGRSQTSPTTTR